MRPTAKSTLRQNTGWMLLGQGLGYGFRIVYFIVIARLLGVLQYGIVVGAFALVNLVAEHSRLGTGTILLRYVSPNHKRFAQYWGNTLLVTLSMSGLLIVMLRMIAPKVLDPASAAVVVLTAVGSCLCEQITISATQTFQAFQKMQTAAILNQLTSLLRCLAAIAMLVTVHHATARDWALASLFASAGGTVVSLVTVTMMLGQPSLSPALALKHLKEGAEYAFASSTTSAYNDLDKTMLSHYGLSAANGIYGMAYRIIEMATVPITSLQMAASPRLFQLAADGVKEPIHLGNKMLKHGLLISLIISLSTYSFAPAIPLLAGSNFGEAVVALRWLCLLPVFRCLHSISGSVLTSIGLQRYRTVTQISVVALNLCLNLWLIPTYGWLGAAWASLATDGTLGLLNWTLMERARRRLTQHSKRQTMDLRADTSQLIHDDILVSIIIPYFNHPQFIGDAVLSATQQTYSNIEVIVVDDGSAVAADSVVCKSPLVSLFRTENHGVSDARNTGFARSSGKFLVFLDSDDRLAPDAVQSHLNLFRDNPEVGLTFGASRIIDKDGVVIRAPHICRPRNCYFEMLLGSNPISCPGAAMIRRDAFLDAGMFDSSYKNADDYHLYLRLAKKFPVKQQDKCVVDYRKHGGGKSLHKERMLTAVMRALDEMEQSWRLNAREVRKLQRGRSRWLHTFQPERTLRYRLMTLYFSFRAMLTVSVRHYF